MSSERERQFHRDTICSAERLKREIGYNATRFIQMVGEMGGVEAARHLLQCPNASDGFTTLWEHRRLEMSVEAHVLLPWYRELFTEEQLGIAEQRLREHGFDVDALLTRAEHDRPTWVAREETERNRRDER